MVRINCVFRDGSFKEARRLLLLLFFIDNLKNSIDIFVCSPYDVWLIG